MARDGLDTQYALQRDILRRSRRQVRSHVTLVTEPTAAFSSDGMKAAATNAPAFARQRSMMSRLPTVNG